jgi:hypothetical protein
MSELERALRELAELIDVPPPPDLAGRVSRDLPGRDRWVWTARVAVAAAIVAGAIGTAFAIPPARSAILRLFGVGAVQVEIVDRLPQVQRRPFFLGAPIAPDAAPLRLFKSKLVGPPDAVFQLGNAVTQLYGTRESVRLLITEIGGSGFNSGVGKKLGAAGTVVEFVPVRFATGPAVWIQGKPHVLEFPGGPPRLAANTLLFERGALTIRIEGALALDQARRIAESLH